MLDLDTLDLQEIATALSDQTDYEHRWLIDPETGEISFWTRDGGIDGSTPGNLDDLNLISIDPLPSYVWYQDMVGFAECISDDAASRGLMRAIQGKVPFAASRTNCTRTTRTSCRYGTASVRPAPCAARSGGSSTTHWSTRNRRAFRRRPPRSRVALIWPNSLTQGTDHRSGVQSVWWAQLGSNQRHPACKAGALPLSYAPLRSDRHEGTGGGPTLPQLVAWIRRVPRWPSSTRSGRALRRGR